MKIVIDEQGNKYKVEPTALEPFSDRILTAKVLKSFRTEGGAADYIKMTAHRHPGAIITKSLGDYDSYDMGGMQPTPSMPVHVVIEEDMSPVATTVSVKNADDMFREMYRKGLISADSGMLMPSGKFYELLTKFTEQAMNDFMKSSTPDAEKTEDGAPMVDVITEAYGILKSAGKLALTQEESDNKEGDSRTEALGDKKGAAEEAIDGRPAAGGDASPENQALTQEESDNKSGDNRITPITDAEVKEKMGDIQITKSAAEARIFKSLGDVNAYVKKNPGYYVDSPTLDELDTYGRRYKFVAREYEKKEFTGYGNRKPRK